MGKVLPEPLKVVYPVDFWSGGDTTRDAFHKHIQEIEKIYSYLQALDAGKVSADDMSGSLANINTALKNHIDSTNPHPKWKPSFSDISGTLDASKVVGKLTNATIDASKVEGLESYVNGKIPESKGDGIVESKVSLLGAGYAKFGNGLILQWGRASITRDKFNEQPHSITFPLEFAEKCYIVTAGTEAEIDDSNTSSVDTVIQVKSITKTGFKFMAQEFYKNSYNDWTVLSCNYVAIGK